MTKLRSIYIWILWLFLPVQILAQERNIAITPLLAEQENVPEELYATLQQKLLQVATNNGYGAYSQDFILTAQVSVLEKEAIPTVPPQIKLQLEVSFYVINRPEQIIVAEKSIIINGMGKSENRAYTEAFKQLNPRKPEIRSFMANAKEKIVEYYIDRTPALIAKAKSLAKRGDSQEALIVLSAIPESVSEYPYVCELMSQLYLKALDEDCAIILQKAKRELAVKNYDEALDLLVTVDPLSTHFTTAGQMIDSIRQSISAEEQQRHEEALLKQQQEIERAERIRADEVMLKKMQLEASYKYAEAKVRQKELETAWLLQLLQESLNQ